MLASGKIETQLRVFNATIHMDETHPHLHLDYISVATGYKKQRAKAKFAF